MSKIKPFETFVFRETQKIEIWIDEAMHAYMERQVFMNPKFDGHQGPENLVLLLRLLGLKAEMVGKLE